LASLVTTAENPLSRILEALALVFIAQSQQTLRFITKAVIGFLLVAYPTDRITSPDPAINDGGRLPTSMKAKSISISSPLYAASSFYPP
jgi:hypothetical protein